MSEQHPKILIAASGTGGHLFPALAVAERLPSWEIEWLGVPNRLETTLVPRSYPLHTIDLEGFQTPFGFQTLSILGKIVKAIARVRQILTANNIEIVFTTGGYIAAPAIIAAKLAHLPVIIHESNYIPGKVTKLLGHWCDAVAIGFEGAGQYLPRAKTTFISTPVRSQFYQPQPLDLPIPPAAPLIVVVGGSQGAVALNQLVRHCAHAWLELGAAIVHLTGEKDPDVGTIQHPHYLEMPFFDNMAGLLQRANLAIGRSGAGTLTELAVTRTPSILIPYPFAAENHQFYNAKVFADAGAALLFPQEDLTWEILRDRVSALLNNPQKLHSMANCSLSLLTDNGTEKLIQLLANALTGANYHEITADRVK